MKKLLIFGGITGMLMTVLAVGAAVFFVGRAYAQTSTPPTAAAPWGGGMMGAGRHGGMMGGRGGMMGTGEFGPMHTYMQAALADALGLSTEELQTRLANGETPYTIAQSQGLSDEQIATLFNQAHEQALAAAVEAGALTQEQADWMDQHHDQMQQNGFVPGSGNCPMGGQGGGMHGGWNK